MGTIINDSTGNTLVITSNGSILSLKDYLSKVSYSSDILIRPSTILANTIYFALVNTTNSKLVVDSLLLNTYHLSSDFTLSGSGGSESPGFSNEEYLEILRTNSGNVVGTPNIIYPCIDYNQNSNASLYISNNGLVNNLTTYALLNTILLSGNNNRTIIDDSTPLVISGGNGLIIRSKTILTNDIVITGTIKWHEV